MALAGAAPATAAVDTCPNAAVRAQQNGTSLPECRAYEQVTPPVKGGNDAGDVRRILADGTGVGVSVTGTFEGAAGSLTSLAASRRTDGGWQTTLLNPPTRGRAAGTLDQFWFAELSADMSRSLTVTQYPVDSRDQGGPPTGNSYDVYRTDASGGVAWITHGHRLPDTSSLGAGYAGGSSDLGLVVTQTKRALTPEIANETTQHLYISDGSTIRLVSVAPGGGPIPGGAVIDGGGNLGVGVRMGGPQKRWVSSDAQTVIFRSPATGAGQLYLRTDAWDATKGKTRQVSRSADGLTECTGAGAKTVGLSPDGSRVLFICANALTAGAPAAGGMYSYDTATHALSFMPGSTGVHDGILAMDPDGHYYYFSNTSAGVQLFHDGKVTSLGKLGVSEKDVSISPDGSLLAFASATAGLDPTRNPNGLKQVYAFNADTGTLRCASCPPDGTPARSEATLTSVASSAQDYNGADSRITSTGNISEDGRRVFFSTDSVLVPEDVNGVTDAYMVLDGAPYLISSGTHRFASRFVGASADGSTAFILTRESLVPQDIDQGGADVYAVRVNGGFAAPSETGAGCVGDACQSVLAPPVLSSAGTAAFSGPGNPSMEPDAVRGDKVRVTRPKVVKKGTTVKLLVRAPGKGTIRVSGSGLVQSRKAAKKSGSYRVAVRLSPRAKRTLRRKHRVSVRATVRFVPASGKASSVRVRVQFKTKAKAKAKAKSKSRSATRASRRATVLSSDSRKGR